MNNNEHSKQNIFSSESFLNNSNTNINKCKYNDLSLDQIMNELRISKFTGTLFECVDQHKKYIPFCHCTSCFEYKLYEKARKLKYKEREVKCNFSHYEYEKFKNYKLILNSEYQDVNDELKKLRINQKKYIS